MKMELFPFSAKKKKVAKGQGAGENASRGNEGSDLNSSSSDVMDKIAAGVSSSLGKNTAKKHGGHDSAVDIIVDSDDEDEIFDDDDDEDDVDDEDEGGQGSEVPAASLDYRDVLAAGASVVQKVMNAADIEEDSQRTGDSYHSSEGEDHDEGRGKDTESDDDDKKNEKGGGGSDSGEDYTDDEDEGEDGYRPGGYHPVKIGEVYNQR
jgi:hypothetical protein